MTGLNLLPRKEFEVILTDGTVHTGKLGTWALARFGQKRKIGLSAIGTLLGEGQIMDMLDLVVCSVECKVRETGKPMTFNDIILCQWIDDYQEEHGESGFALLWNHVQGEDIEEKKSQEESPLSGENSNG